MREFSSLGMPVARALEITGPSRHEYYYRPKPDRKPAGRKPSATTRHTAGDGAETELDDEGFAAVVRELCADPDLHYGYHTMGKQLRGLGYAINDKKLYRVMKHLGLLHERRRPTTGKRVQQRRFEVDGPLQGLEMDIKFIYVEEHRRHAFALTVLDVFTREVLDHHLGSSITQADVRTMWARIIEGHLQPADLLARGITVQIRNDNDPRFKAKTVQAFFAENHLDQVFTHVYTPQENGHIESFHAILGRGVGDRAFPTLTQLQDFLTGFYEKYNTVRLHGSTAHLPPAVFRREWERGHVLVTADEKQRQRFRLTVPYAGLLSGASGNTSPRPLVAHNS